MMYNDLINGMFEFAGAGINLLNVRAILRDKKLQGVHWSPYAFFTSWGIWNLWYYPSLDQWFSFVGGAAIVIVNGTWLALALYYIQKEKNDVISRS